MTGSNFADNPDPEGDSLAVTADPTTTGIEENNENEYSREIVDESETRSEVFPSAEEEAVANYLRFRTAASVFFEANPAPSLPIFDIDGKFRAFVC